MTNKQTVTVEHLDEAKAMELIGFQDKNLKLMEELFGCTLVYRDASFIMMDTDEHKKENFEKFSRLDHTNFHKYATDLIGIRVFFLYREDWIHFHKYITKRFENNPELYIRDRLNDFDEDPDHYYIAERPKAYKRAGDSKIYDGSEIDIITDGIYRSLHYIIKYKGKCYFMGDYYGD